MSETILIISSVRGLNILPILLKRLDDKPNVIIEAEKVTQHLISKVSIQALPIILKILACEIKL